MSRIRRAYAWITRPFRTAPVTGRTAAPLWVRGLTAGGRPIVLGVALLMCAPGEYHLAENAGWNDPFTYGMPVVLSAYAGIAAAVASTRRSGDRGRWSAIIGACLALGLAMAAQIVSHLIDTGHMAANQPMLIAVTSLVPPAVVGHLLHLAASPPDKVPDAPQDAPDTEDAPAADTVLSVPPIPDVVPAGVHLLPVSCRRPATVTLERDDPQDAARTLELEAGMDQDVEDVDDGPAPEPPLMTSAQVAEHYGISPSTVRNWVSLGRIPVHSKDASGRNLFHPEQLPTFQVGVLA
ncbi:helix-turn-helix domain-containing protein [Streptomyces sp. NPDC020607]|uniref:helix-turn-helix domain-containing protein n=1 Tax=Streptomyces sp. NPDC020607 TaxID=3365082 RepID=UPI00378D8B25